MKTLPQRRLLGACTVVIELLLLLLAHCVCVCARACVNDVFCMIFPNEIAAQKNTRKSEEEEEEEEEEDATTESERYIAISTHKKKSFARETNHGE